MGQIPTGAVLQRPASLNGSNGSSGQVRPLAETIDLSHPISFSDSFAIRCSGDSGKTTELRIGEAQDHLFVRVKSDGMMMELSSGLLHDGVRCEAWHGVASGDCVKGSLLLQCTLKFDGDGFKLDLRLQGGSEGCDTLIYGSGRFQGASFVPTAEVGLHDVSGDQAVPSSVRETRSAGSANGANGTKGANGANGGSTPARKSRSSVRFCPADEWYEYEVPAPIRVASGG